jgi:hypothetical protein
MAVDRRPPRPTSAADARRCQHHAPPDLLGWGGGACLAVAGTLLLGALAVAPAEGLALLLACALLPLLGREAAIPAGLLAGGHPALLAALLLPVDAGLLLALAPRVAGPQPPAVVATASRRRNAARRPRSATALFLRALAPFTFLGPLVATHMGEAAGLPRARLLLAVAAASAVAVLAWTGFYAGALLLLGRPALVAALAVAVPLALLGAALAFVGLWRGSRAALRA